MIDVGRRGTIVNIYFFHDIRTYILVWFYILIKHHNNEEKNGNIMLTFSP